MEFATRIVSCTREVSVRAAGDSWEEIAEALSITVAVTERRYTEAVQRWVTARVGAALPALIRDLHATAAHRDTPEVLRLLTVAHMQGTQAWLTTVGAPP